MMKANLAAQKALYSATCNDPEPPNSCPLLQPMLFGGPALNPGAVLGGLGAGALLIGAPEALPALIPALVP